MHKSANERTFQGRLFIIAQDIIERTDSIQFEKVFQELNTGIERGETGKRKNWFSDGIITSSTDLRRKVFIELKDASWDATDDDLVNAAAAKAYSNGAAYFVTGTPRQLVLYRTFEEFTTLQERKLKIYTISNIKKDDEILLSSYETSIAPKLKLFLQELSDIVHGVKEVTWDSIDKYYVNRLSNYILEASASMEAPMARRISRDKEFQKRIREYLTEQDIFNVSTKFEHADIYNLCQLTNYLLFLKLIFYSYLQRDVPALKLRPIVIPQDKRLLNKTLRKHFDDVLQHDFEMIFSENVLDEFEYEENYLPVLRQHVDHISKLNFTDLNADLIGAIYNTLIDNQEQHDRGQHFTNTNEVDIVNAFCIKTETKLVMDSGCGAGTFLVRAYYFMRQFHPKLTHEELLERLWGIEIADFPAFLAAMNLSLQSVKTLDNYPVIIQSDFSKVSGSSHFNLMYLNASNSVKVKKLDKRHCEVTMPVFDACIGNPPYIKQTLLDAASKNKWNQLAQIEWNEKHINGQSDLYVYYLMHTAAFLKEGGRLGYVISSTWLDVAFGTGLQKFLLDNFKIIAIIDHQNTRSFETALVNTVILILEKCSDKKERERNNVRFVKVTTDYENLIGKTGDPDRFKRVRDWAGKIESLDKDASNQNFVVTCFLQRELEAFSTYNGKYENGNWGARFFRSPNIFFKMVKAGKGKLFPVSHFVDIKRGFTTAANEFFYVTDETEKALNLADNFYKLQFGIKRDADIASHKRIWEKYGWFYSDMNNQHYIIERYYTQPILKNQKEANNLDVDVSLLKYRVIMCSDTKDKLGKFKNKLLKYIMDAEALGINQRESYKVRKLWYDLKPFEVVGDFIFPSKIFEVYGLIDNRETRIYCDKVNYAITVKPEYSKYSDTIFLLMNSIAFRFLLDLFSRQMAGSLSDIDVNVAEKTLILNPELLKGKQKELTKIMKALKGREQRPIHEEILNPDRRALDELIFAAIGLSSKDVSEFYTEASAYVSRKKHKTDSVVTKKSKGKLSNQDATELIKERFSELSGYASLIEGIKTRSVSIPEWEAKYPKGAIGEDNLFGHYNVYFKQGNTQQTLSFTSPEQLKLFEFLNRTLEVRKQKLDLPEGSKHCKEILQTLRAEFDDAFPLIKSLLKSHRSKANPIAVYREVLMEQ